MPIHRDSRGTLVVAEFAPLPFIPRRLFWLLDITPGETRANHAHRVCEQRSSFKQDRYRATYRAPMVAACHFISI